MAERRLHQVDGRAAAGGADVARDPACFAVWVELMVASCREAHRVLTRQGHLICNMPLDTTTGGYRQTYAQLVRSPWRPSSGGST